MTAVQLRIGYHWALWVAGANGDVSAHQKKGIWRAIVKEVRTLGVYHRLDLRRWTKKTAEAQLGFASQSGRGARRTMTPLMFRILAVAYPELSGRLRASQQPQGGEYRF
ncbi:hypothetical protein NDU88_002912 [Pleurodeles waltl]|uniref:Uncharacterized protein n=1 Tax=Pleurodeles waltl TaxID=8319 RepID=A0AAV7WS18_PLEWA|nr:hypothetical protein NDU88_002912 [Pleurodeles waltl]